MTYAPTRELNNIPVGIGEESVQQFLRDIREYPLLTAQQELELAKRCAEADEVAIRQMVHANLRLVVSLAREYAGRGVPLVDLIQEGCIGLLAAAKKYDYTKECRFATYATLWIRQSIKRYLDNQGGLIRVPPHTADQIRRMNAAANALRQATGQDPTAEQIALECDLDLEKVLRLQQLQPETCSLDAPIGEEDTVGILVEDLRYPQPQEMLVRQALTQTMEKLLSMLPQRENQVLRLHFGLEDGKCYSLAQISTILGVSKERVRQIEKQAMERLKEFGADMGLEDFLE
jgi:RNA polymerase primary sigma factor